MKRHSLTPRTNWQQQVEALGFDFHSPDGNVYWDERACYSFSAAEIDMLETATNELEAMCLKAVRYVIDNNLFNRLNIPPIAQDMITESWRAGDKHFYGRFDLAYDGHHPPKLLEYNADTPTALLEASVVQWQWLESLMPEKDQFNSIHERLIDAWQRIGINGKLHFASTNQSPEDLGTTIYLQDCANQAGLDTHFITMGDIGSDNNHFYDMDNNIIHNLFKLYPWEWMWEEEFAPLIHKSGLRIIEPAWKMLLSNKGILAILWEMFENHPYLLKASLVESAISGDVVKKPIYGREGSNVTIRSQEANISTKGTYGAEGYVTQEYFSLPVFDGNYPIIGSWVVASQAAGMGIREDSSRITSDSARFIPHYFE
ncbi:MAG: glutathionylspermidine synthase family protein [Alphaproteobacteria bacterium]